MLEILARRKQAAPSGASWQCAPIGEGVRGDGGVWIGGRKSLRTGCDRGRSEKNIHGIDSVDSFSPRGLTQPVLGACARTAAAQTAGDAGFRYTTRTHAFDTGLARSGIGRGLRMAPSRPFERRRCPTSRFRPDRGDPARSVQCAVFWSMADRTDATAWPGRRVWGCGALRPAAGRSGRSRAVGTSFLISYERSSSRALDWNG
jgi:hypothetical protein